MMAADHEFPNLRRVLGPGLLLIVVLVAGAFLEATADEGTEAWFVRAFLIVGILAIAAYVFLVYLPERNLERHLEELEARYEAQCASVNDALEEMRFGDLVAAVDPIDGLPEQLQSAVESATGAMAALIQQIQNSSVEVASSAASVRETAAELAAGSSEQAASVVEITATMEQLARTAGTIAGAAASQADLAARSEAAGNDGARALESAVSGVGAVREQMEVIADRADSLGNRAREIYRVLDLINEIAHETHILSLNAAIEASAAGEHGERFSVVADEVRRLAERSRESVDSVQTQLDEFSTAIRAVIVSTEEGSKAAAEVLERSRATQDSIAQLRNALSDTAQAAREISLATQEQGTASDQVVVTLREGSEVIQRMAEGLVRFTGAADDLNHLALSIQLLTQTFRLESKHSLKDHAASWATRLTDYTANLEGVDGLLDDLLEACPYLELVYLVDQRGTMVSFVVNHEMVDSATVPDAVAVGRSYDDRPWFQAVARERRAVVTPLYDSLLTGEKCFTIATAVFSPEGTMSGALGMDVNARNWTRI
jgi:methyl-accepting chemotaxis protein